jgi:hypothetical protein
MSWDASWRPRAAPLLPPRIPLNAMLRIVPVGYLFRRRRLLYLPSNEKWSFLALHTANVDTGLSIEAGRMLRRPEGRAFDASAASASKASTRKEACPIRQRFHSSKPSKPVVRATHNPKRSAGPARHARRVSASFGGHAPPYPAQNDCDAGQAPPIRHSARHTPGRRAAQARPIRRHSVLWRQSHPHGGEALTRKTLNAITLQR